MIRSFLKILWIPLFLLLFLMPASAQDVYWEAPRQLSAPGTLFFDALSTGTMAVMAWQEFIPNTKGEGGQVYISLWSSRDLKSWVKSERFAGPFKYTDKQIKIYSLFLKEDNTILVAVTTGEKHINIYRSSDEGRTFNQTRLISQISSINPVLSVNKDGNYLLFVTSGTEDSLAIFYSSLEPTLFEEESQEIVFFPFVKNPSLRLNFLPRHVSYKGIEYVVFQSRLFISDEKIIGYQVYLSASYDGGKTWGEEKLITGFSENAGPLSLKYEDFINQRPQLSIINEEIYVVWERQRQTGGYNQIYRALVDNSGSFVSFERITDNNYNCLFPNIFRYQNETFVIWFDNRRGDDNIFIAKKKTRLNWEDKNLTYQLSGNSRFAQPLILNGFLYILWENTVRSVTRIYLLEPDQTVLKPGLSMPGFKPGVKYKDTKVRFNWSAPNDSSGIYGFRYQWSRSAIPSVEDMTEVFKDVTTGSFNTNDDGSWYFHLQAGDYAGNWSDTITLTYERDTTPPYIVTFDNQDVDETGYLQANTFDVKWNPSPLDTDIAGYAYLLQYLSSDPEPMLVNFNWSLIKAPEKKIQTFNTVKSYQNLDDGLWAFTVIPFDTVGNVGGAATVLLKLNKYVPVTAIYSITPWKDDLEVTHARINGRGFLLEGKIREIYLDLDGRAPYDYTYGLQDNQFRIRNDRLIDNLVFEEVEEGRYRLILNHEVRGLYNYRGLIQVDATGNPKIYPPIIEEEQRFVKSHVPSYSVPFNLVPILLVVLLTGVFLLAATGKVLGIVQDGRAIRAEVQALILGPGDKFWKEAQMKKLKLKGMGLRLKFTGLFAILVILILSMVSVPLSYYMIQTQRSDLSNGLVKQVQVLLGSLATGAKDYLPLKRELQLGLLVRNTEVLEEAVSASITGISGKESRAPTKNEFIWATNDLNITGKIKGEDKELKIGISIMEDDVSRTTQELSDKINTTASAQVSGLLDRIKEMTDDAGRLALKSDVNSLNRVRELGQEIADANQEVQVILDQVEAGLTDSDGDGVQDMIFSFPEFNPDTLVPLYIFYKPIIYRTPGEDIFFRGMVRIEVSTDNIVTAIENSRNALLIQIGIISLIALGLGIVGAIILSTIIIRPIRKLAAGVAKIRDTDDKSQLKDHIIAIKQKDEIRMLADTINQMTQGLVKAAAANKDLIVGKETQKMFIPLQKDESGKKGTTGEEQSDYVDIFGYYEGAKGVSGDYFDFKKLDDKHYCVIKCDVAGKGVPASLIMVEVATIFIDHFRSWNPSKPNMNISKLVYRINDLVEERGFKGRFAAFTLGIINVQTGVCHMCNAGDKVTYVYNNAKKSMEIREMPQAPAAGVFPSMLVEMQSGFQQVKMPLETKDALFLWTDGLDEAKRMFRDKDFNYTTCREPGLKDGEEHGGTHLVTSGDEELGLPRLFEVINSVFNQKKYQMIKYHDPTPKEAYTFDFTKCKGTVKEAVLAMISVEKVFRMYKDPSATIDDKVIVDKKVDLFLQEHFEQYARYFINRIENEDNPAYVIYTHLKEDEQYDDLTVLAIRKK